MSFPVWVELFVPPAATPHERVNGIAALLDALRLGDLPFVSAADEGDLPLGGTSGALREG